MQNLQCNFEVQAEKILLFHKGISFLSTSPALMTEKNSRQTTELSFDWEFHEKSLSILLCIFGQHFKTRVGPNLAVDIVYPDFSKAFETVPHNLLLEKIMHYGLDKGSVWWMGNLLLSFRINVMKAKTKYK